ncbi:RNA polymerase sigma factor [Pseudobacter ginsenosidimutans]|uniref:RNA polymerase sigma factor (Sigma-70 family) n=1 Tax=Pseudobacter ginsenosidimutans TaxID=661488 RepID=A0A4Q7N4I7_9BACT|nr:sigma-70 family RNA polymerase sigma factor [Pseudobacter ginsenosidimutans]QEC44429.1 sigma-70 family RNA polymerase sigma factor [Pseudobacter ginsenosidimutans]RZS75900.1 RNA polymerase sigma factor (sigma-70 family) [Pseudobacter ginsenosidimutans]
MATTQPYPESELLLRLAAGEEGAMKALYESYFSRLYYFAFKMIGVEREAEDIAQEALMSFWQRRDQFTHSTLKEAGSYLFTIARNRCYNYTRDKNTRISKHAEIAAEQEISEDSLTLNIIREDIFNRIYQEIQQLAPAQVALLKMIFIENLDTAEIAERLQTTPNNVRNQKARALEKLKTALLRKKLLTQILLLFY